MANGDMKPIATALVFMGLARPLDAPDDYKVTIENVFSSAFSSVRLSVTCIHHTLVIVLAFVYSFSHIGCFTCGHIMKLTRRK